MLKRKDQSVRMAHRYRSFLRYSFSNDSCTQIIVLHDNAFTWLQFLMLLTANDRILGPHSGPYIQSSNT